MQFCSLVAGVTQDGCENLNDLLIVLLVVLVDFELKLLDGVPDGDIMMLGDFFSGFVELGHRIAEVTN